MRFRLFPTLQSASEARRRLDPFADSLDQGSLSDARSVISELVGISVAHQASRPIDVAVELVGERIEGVVHDDGPGARALARARDGKDDSLVLRIIDGLVDDWGTDDGQTEVWFRMSVRRAGPHQNGAPADPPDPVERHPLRDRRRTG